ncbi:hypothetical protein LTR94_023557 [Friedmanniomyces endolithicus]|nr:hypothetical protein LTR94_023557 [Friedmanniomyces endolithicus]
MATAVGEHAGSLTVSRYGYALARTAHALSSGPSSGLPSLQSVQFIRLERNLDPACPSGVVQGIRCRTRTLPKEYKSRATLEKLLYRMLLRRLEKKQAADRVGYLRYMSTEYGDFETDKDVEAYLVRMLARDIKDELDDEFSQHGVLSLSATWSSALMWSHYADEHRGICVEYDTTDQEHPNLGPVSYRAPRAVKASDLARWKGSDDAAARDRVLQTYFYAKSSEWKYEREWRDVREDNGVKELPFRISAIHFGLRCDHAVISSMVRLLNDQPQIKLYTISPKEETFKLRRSRLDAEDIAEINATAISEPGWLMFKDVFWEEELGNLPETGGEALPEVPDPAS